MSLPTSPTRPPTTRRRRVRTLVTLTTTAAAAVGVVAAAGPARAADLTAPVFAVVAEGLTADDGKSLSDRARIPNALRADGSFAFQAETYAKPPLVTVGEGRSEDGTPTTSQALDPRALAALTVPSNAEALKRAADLLPLPAPYGARAIVGHTSVEQTDAKGAPLARRDLDTTVSYQFTLGGRPVVGPGARVSVAFAGDGSVQQLTHALRRVEQTDVVRIITPAQAKRACSILQRGVEQGTPSLAYYAPALAATRASGEGAARTVTPQYVCQPTNVAKDAVSALTGRLVPAAPELSPTVVAVAETDGRTTSAKAEVSGGTAPYRYSWSSSSTPLASEPSSQPSLSYVPKSRGRAAETLTLVVTDANGVSSTLALTPSTVPGGAGRAEATGRPGGTGGAFHEAGIEQTVDEWDCAQASAQGFREVMQARSQTVNFDFRGTNAWERDFRDPSLGGNDTNYADAVDIQWYTGHGWPGGFTFKNTTRDDGSIVPADASFGNTDLEWLNLESCQVLRDTTATYDFFDRWGPAMDGLHLLNGFDTNATCVGGGTGRTFASLLFPQQILFWTIPARTVAQAWAATANSLEPAGTKWRSMSLVGPGGVNNLGDFYWGQGPTGPDLTYDGRAGMIAISGVA